MDLQSIFHNESEKPLERLIENGGYTAIFRTICCIGDSLSSGEFEAMGSDGQRSYHDMFEYSWGQYMARTCGSKVYNFSRGGMTAKEYCDSFADANGFWNAAYASQAYILALGVNDILGQNMEIGNIGDVDFADWHNNKKNFIGYYSEIIQRMKAMQPRAKFFLVTMPREDKDTEEWTRRKQEHRKVLYDLAAKFDNTYVIDLQEYAPVYDKEFKEKFYLLGHMNPMGYLFTAQVIASYIDYIIRHNMKDFFEVGYIGTELHGEQ